MTKSTETVVESFVADYEFRGDAGDYTPNNNERALITDAIYGFLATQKAEVAE